MKSKLLEWMQKNRAVGGAGASTLTGQGHAKMVATAREYLNDDVDLREFSRCRRQEQSDVVLERHTRKLAKRFPYRRREKPNWGAAREVLNIFLRDAVYHRYLCSYYSLAPICRFLEVAVDRSSAEGIRKDYEEHFKRRLPLWPGIKRLTRAGEKTRSGSDQLQKAALDLAKTFRVARVYLDLKDGRQSADKSAHSKVT